MAALPFSTRDKATRDINDGSGEIDSGGKAGVSFVGLHGDTLEFLELAEEVFDQMPPFVDIEIDGDGLGASWMLGNDDLRTTLVEVGDDGVAVESFVCDQPTEIDAFDERFDADGIEPVSRHENEADQIAQRIGQGEDLGRHAAFGMANGLAESPPFAPCP